MKKFRYIVFISCSVVLLFHIGCTLIFNFTTTPDNTIVQRVVRRYMLPVFSQNNKVFAPDPPGGKQQLWVRYYAANKGWTVWYNDGKTYLDKTYKNRFSIASYKNRVHEYVLGQLYNIYTTSPNYTPNGIRDKTVRTEVQDDYLRESMSCQMAVRYFSGLVENENNHSVYDSLQYKVLFVCPEKFSGKPYAEIKADTTTFNFPVMKLTPSIPCLK